MTKQAYSFEIRDDHLSRPRFGAANNGNAPADDEEDDIDVKLDNINPQQERFNLEMFRALELLGRKLERVEKERDGLAKRLEQIEAATAVDEATGRLYLPAVIETAPQSSLERNANRWAIGGALASSVLALCALGMVILRAPQPALTPQQLAALDTLGTLQLARLDGGKTALPDAKTLAQDESGAQDARTVAENIAKQMAEVQPAAGAATDGLPGISDAAASGISAGLPPQAQRREDIALAAEKLINQALDAQPVVTAASPAPATAAAPMPAVMPPQPLAAQTVPVQTVTAKAPEATVQKPAPVKTETAKAESKPAAPTPQKAAAAPATVPVTAPATAIAADPQLPASLRALEKRALDGLPEAQHDLGTIYAAGKLVPQDYARAATWFKRAAQMGVANADYNLGVMSQQGLGMAKDPQQAVGWYEKAAKQGHPEALYNLGIIYTKGIGAPVDMPRGVAYFKRAANAGVAQAAYNLGVLYEGDFLGKPDPARAVEWYGVAASQGHHDARAAVLRLKNSLPASTFAKSPQADAATAKKLSAQIEPAAGGATSPATPPADKSAEGNAPDGTLTPGERKISVPPIAPQDR
ncbi:MAG: hypothetical protein GC185_07015 [Alphaproteobacteria bacterium]|nr:hypothetical protein [Alphaproteobacteria bacterium]